MVGRDQLDRPVCLLSRAQSPGIPLGSVLLSVWIVCLLLCDVSYESVCTPGQAELCEKKPGRRFHSVQETPV